MTHKFILIASLLILFASACKETPTPSDHHAHADEQEEHLHEEDVAGTTLSKPQQELAGIETGFPEERRFYGVISASGMIEVPPQSKFSVYSPAAGFVETVRHYVGDPVKKGELLTRITHPDLIRKQGELLEVMAVLDRWSKELDRQDLLKDSGATSGRLIEQAQAEYAMALARYKGLRAELQLIGIDTEKLETGGALQTHIDIRAPAAGRISLLSINPGLFVQPDDLLVEVVDGSHLHLELAVFGKDISSVQQGQQVTFSIPGQSTTYTGEVQQVSRVVDPATKTARVHVHFDDAPLLSPGVYVQAHIQIHPTTHLCVPESAVIRIGNESVVFLTEGNRFIPQEVTTGPALNGFVPLLDSLLTSSTEIVSNGAYSIKGSLEGPREHNH